MPSPKPKRGYWYRSDIYYCPICASSTTYRERVYNEPRPENWEDRNKIIDSWDYCGAL